MQNNKSCHQQSFVNKITWILASLKNNQSFNSTADVSVRLTSLRERKLSLQEEKSIVSSRRIWVKWVHFKISRVFTADILAYSSPAFSFSFSLALFIFFLCLSTYSTSYTWSYSFLQNVRLLLQIAVGHASSRQKKHGLQQRVCVCHFILAYMEGRTYGRKWRHNLAIISGFHAFPNFSYPWCSARLGREAPL